jgi:hypothetical protein
VFEVLAVRVAQQSQRCRPKFRGVIDQDVEPAEVAHDLDGDGVDVVLDGYIADDPVRSRVLPRHLFDAAWRAGDECHARAPAKQLADQGQAQSGGAARDGDAQPGASTGGFGVTEMSHGMAPG